MALEECEQPARHVPLLLTSEITDQSPIPIPVMASTLEHHHHES